MRTILVALLLAQASPGILVRVGEYVEGYYGRARSVVSRETVRLQALDGHLRPVGDWRQLIYEVQLEWDPAKPGEPTTTRRLLSSGGRLATLTGQDSECFDLKDSSVEPLAMLLPEAQKSLKFSAASEPRGRPPVAVLVFTETPSGPPSVSWDGRCGTINLNGNTSGRVWVDPVTGAVHRIDRSSSSRFRT